MADSPHVLRATLFTDVLNSLILTRSSESHEYVAKLQNALSVASLGFGERTEADNGTTLPAGLTETDIRRFGPSSTPMLDVPAQNLIAEEIDSTLRLIANFWNSSTSSSDETRESTSQDLCLDIQARLAEIEASEMQADEAYDRIQLLLQTIQQIHPRLQRRLTHALENFPPEIESRRAASDDLLAMTIETSLVKVSLIRAQVLELVYNYSSPKNSELSMRRALSAAYGKLKEDERELEDEELALDRELAEYQALLDMVDGGGSGGFKQIVADTARVEKETEECRRDLRRLGWTGDSTELH